MRLTTNTSKQLAVAQVREREFVKKSTLSFGSAAASEQPPKPYNCLEFGIIWAIAGLFNLLPEPLRLLLMPVGFKWYLDSHRERMRVTQKHALTWWGISPDSSLGRYLTDPIEWIYTTVTTILSKHSKNKPFQPLPSPN
jgi:hypothetical protein